jgi:hypothetical protein
MRTPSSVIITASLMLAVTACSKVDCLDNEEKVGKTCYPVIERGCEQSV